MVCYSGYNNNLDVLKKSSSGGIFYELAVNVLNENGTVFGAAFKQDGTVCLKGVKNIEELDELLGSKYVQAYTKDVYQEVESELESNRRVLFCGTPCQCNALNEYLGKKHFSNLLVVDFVCHGIPSEGVWREYLSYLNADVENCEISFRDKRNGWENYGIRIKKNNSKEYFNHHGKDKFFQLFISDLILRPSCYSCKSKGENRTSDITLGDFWGENAEINPRGCSLIIENSTTGKNVLREISDRVTMTQISIEEALKKNKSYYKSCTLPYRRKKSFEIYKLNPKVFFDGTEVISKVSLVERVVCKVQRKIEKKVINREKKSYLELKNPEKITAKSLCCGCGACVDGCPVGAIEMELDEEGFLYPRIDDSKCCSCGKCIKICFNYQVQ